MKVENKKANFQVHGYRRIIRPLKDANKIIVNAKSRIVPTKGFSISNFLPPEINDFEASASDEAHKSKSNQDADANDMASDQNKVNFIRKSARNLNRTQKKYAEFESDTDEAKLAVFEDSGSDFEDILKQELKKKETKTT